MQLSHYSFCPFIKTKYLLTCFREKSIDLHGNEMLKVREGKNKVWVKECFVELLRLLAHCFKRRREEGDLGQAEVMRLLIWVEIAKASSATYHTTPLVRS